MDAYRMASIHQIDWTALYRYQAVLSWLNIIQWTRFAIYTYTTVLHLYRFYTIESIVSVEQQLKIILQSAFWLKFF